MTIAVLRSTPARDFEYYALDQLESHGTREGTLLESYTQVAEESSTGDAVRYLVRLILETRSGIIASSRRWRTTSSRSCGRRRSSRRSRRWHPVRSEASRQDRASARLRDRGRQGTPQQPEVVAAPPTRRFDAARHRQAHRRSQTHLQATGERWTLSAHSRRRATPPGRDHSEASLGRRLLGADFLGSRKKSRPEGLVRRFAPRSVVVMWSW
jgi:hypothetical protein